MYFRDALLKNKLLQCSALNKDKEGNTIKKVNEKSVALLFLFGYKKQKIYSVEFTLVYLFILLDKLCQHTTPGFSFLSKLKHPAKKKRLTQKLAKYTSKDFKKKW